jgi:hypothetical protein
MRLRPVIPYRWFFMGTEKVSFTDNPAAPAKRRILGIRPGIKRRPRPILKFLAETRQTVPPITDLRHHS